LTYIPVWRLSSIKCIHTKSRLTHNLWSTWQEYSRHATERQTELE